MFGVVKFFNRLNNTIQSTLHFFVRNQQGKQAIHFAAECGRFESMKILITANADPSAILDFGMSALLYAAGNSQAECIAYLIEHGKDQEACSPNYCSMGQTALHKVCMSEIPTDVAIKVLLDANADVLFFVSNY